MDPKETIAAGKGWTISVGNPDPDPARYPQGMKPIADAAHANGMKFLLWFEPKRVMPATWLHRTHPDWLLPPPPSLPYELSYMRKNGFHLLDLGNPGALCWAKAKVGGMIRRAGIDFCREDFNMYPVDYWRWNEPSDRLGMREIRFITGLYDYWDDLRRQKPSLLIDNCASGGRRIDLETLRRSFVLWRSDIGWRNIEAIQAQQHALSLWLPITGVGANSVEPYNFRSGMGGTFTLAVKYLDGPRVLDAARVLLGQYKSVRHLYEGDFHPLTPYSMQRDVWMAWQFHRADSDESLVQAFRRPDARDETLTVKLSDLKPNARYEVENLDGGKDIRTGRELTAGFAITLKAKPSAAVFIVRAIK